MASLKNIAIVGAGGNSGSYMVTELLKTGMHNVTAITREGSENKLPEGITVAKVDYEKPETVVQALKGQDALIITLSVSAPKELQEKLVDAAIEAGVKWVLPNHWAPDTENEALAKDVVFFSGLKAFQTLLESKRGISHISIACGFWYEWSLAIPDGYGLDIVNKKVTFFDDGKTKISTSTWPQVGRAVASLLSLPVSELEEFKDKVVYIDSFVISQQDMLESVLRVTGDKREDWTITEQPAVERYTNGIEGMQAGDRTGFIHMMYTRVFYPDGNGSFSGRTSNDALKLPKEDLDKATEAAVQRAKNPWAGYGGKK